MGKGNRNKQVRYQDKLDNPDKYLEMRRQQKKKSKNNKTGNVIAIVVCVVLVVAILSAFGVNALSTNGVFIRNQTAMETENFEFNGAMMTYMLNSTISNWYNTYGAYASYFGVDFTTDLKKQVQNKDTGETWYDYFMASTASEVSRLLAYAEGAKAAGLSLSDDDKAEIEQMITDLKSSIGSNYTAYFGKGVKDKDIRKVYEIIYLANAFAEYKSEKIEDELKADDSEVHKYVEDNLSSFYSAKVKYYTFSLKSSDFKLESNYTKAVELVKDYAKKMESAKDPDDFQSLATEYELKLAELKGEKTDAEKETTAETESTTEAEGTTGEAETKEIKKATISEKTVNYTEEGDLGKWLFERKDQKFLIALNAAKSIPANEKDEEVETTDKDGNKYMTYSVTSYIVTETPSRNEKDSHNIGYVITTDKDTADKILSDFNKGEKTPEALEALGKAENEKLGEDSDDLVIFGTNEKANDTFFASNFAGDFSTVDDWLNEKAEKGSVSEVIKVTYNKKDYYVICFNKEAGDKVWYVNATNGAVNKLLDEWYQGTEDDKGKGGQLAVTPVTKNDKLLAKLDTIRLFQSSSAQ